MKNIFVVFVFSLVYICLFTILNNYSLFYTTIISSFPWEVKRDLLFSLFTGLGSTMSLVNLITLVVIAFLTSINLVLLYKRIRLMKAYGSMNFVVGGSSLLGLASSGCASCGLPLLAFFGLGSSVGLLPFKGYEFSILTIGLLLISCWILIKQLREEQSCEVPEAKT